jgi:hypothetical protein
MTRDWALSRRAWITMVGRTVVSGSALAAVAALRAEPAQASVLAPRRIVVYKDPDCGCCKAWVEHLRTHGFAPEVHDRADMDTLKDSLGVPRAMRSCHTAVAGRYLIEGHVPAADITRLLTMAPRTVVGLAVPGMPAGSPGMEMPGSPSARYDVMAFGDPRGPTVFAAHG